MNAYLLHRSLGLNSPRVLERAETTHLLHALQPTDAQFHGDSGDVSLETGIQLDSPAHASGVNAITIDKFEGR